MIVGGKMDLLLSLCYIALNFAKFIPFPDRIAAIKNIFTIFANMNPTNRHIY